MAAGTGEGSRRLPLCRVVQGLEIDHPAVRDAASTGRWQKAATRNWHLSEKHTQLLFSWFGEAWEQQQQSWCTLNASSPPLEQEMKTLQPGAFILLIFYCGSKGIGGKLKLASLQNRRMVWI